MFDSNESCLNFYKRVNHTNPIIRSQAFGRLKLVSFLLGSLPKACGLMIELV